MLKWVLNWSDAKILRDSLRKQAAVIWAIKMPPDYPECRVTRAGVASIAITDDEIIAAELREDGGEARVIL